MLRNKSLQLFSVVATEVKAAEELRLFPPPPPPFSANCRYRLFLEATAEIFCSVSAKLCVIVLL